MKDRSDQRKRDHEIQDVKGEGKFVRLTLGRRRQIECVADGIAGGRVLIKDTIEEVKDGLIGVLPGARVRAIVKKAAIVQPILYLW